MKNIELLDNLLEKIEELKERNERSSLADKEGYNDAIKDVIYLLTVTKNGIEIVEKDWPEDLHDNHSFHFRKLDLN